MTKSSQYVKISPLIYFNFIPLSRSESVSKGFIDNWWAANFEHPPLVGMLVDKVGKKIITHVPMKDGEVQELGDFVLDGVTFPAAEIKLEFLDLGASDEETGGVSMFPTGNPIDILDIFGVGEVGATLINAGNPAIFISAVNGLTGTELQGDINSNGELLKQFEAIRAHGAVGMGVAESVEFAMSKRQHTPKIAFFAEATGYNTSDGKKISDEDIDILARILSMGKLHHAMTGTGAVAIAAAAAIPGTIVSRILRETMSEICFSHPSGSLKVGAEAEQEDGGWVVKKVVMSRSARKLMEGSVLIPNVIDNLGEKRISISEQNRGLSKHKLR
ncbi:PrpF domain-containing protein [Ureibacillus sp. NPDC094379]